MLLFKSKNWITSLSAPVGHEYLFTDVGNCSFTSTAGGQLFYISLDMTNIGLNHVCLFTCHLIIHFFSFCLIVLTILFVIFGRNMKLFHIYIYQYLLLLKTCGSQPLRSLIGKYKSLLEMKYQCLEFDLEQLGDLAIFSQALAGLFV